ncbi:hypothetical protein SARC_05681 [Sphaeroforma arctica JP610]|uniref:BHLH domain-containing protein n=1 Tax=Sphaeroforma arctica JP610 TaxID=667725 RepID=A0A0L0FZM7_9EUKA|nr:hypothetical protein SARC_05681 [Sphaeroforma arctica JP610]KNC82021.1 hypothetical protein SARC_05681 [Sphaeroforma arctica JP610]|eukprot:XP_014155923.1 hypothetical protein SARC_05681 [Sphaeroforma arctica JP610]
MAGHYNPPPHQPIATQLFNTSTLPPIGSQHSMTSTLPPIGSQHSMTSTLPPIGSQHSMTSTLPPIGSQNSFNGTLHLHDPLSSHSLAEREATHAHLATLFMQHQTKDKANGQRMSGSPHTHPTHHTPHTTQHTNGTTAPPTSAHAHTHTSPQGSAGTPQALANTHSHGTLDMSANGSVGHTVRTPEDSAIECSSGKTNSRSNSHSHRSSNATDYGHCPHTQQETGASTTSVNATAANATPGTQPTNGAAPQYTIAETQPSAAQGERSCTFEECQERTVAEIMGHGADVHPNDTDSTQLHLGRLSIDASGSAANNASDGAMGYDRGAGHVDSLTEGSLCMLKEAYKYPTIVDWVARRTLGGKPPNDSTGMAIDDTATNFPTLTSLDDMNDTEMEEAFNGLVNNITLPAINMTKYRAHPQPQSHPTDNMYTHHTHASLSHSHSANTLQSHTTQSSDGSGATNTHPNTHTNTELVSGLDSHVGASAYEHTPSGTVNGAYNWGAFNTYQGLANGEYEDILKETFGMTGEDAINVLADSLSERVELGDDAKGPAGPDLENGARGPDLAQDRLLHQDSAASTNNAGSDTHTPQDEANRITTTTTTAATTTTNTITTTNITTTTTTDITNGKSKGTATATDATAAEATAKKGGKRKPTAKEIKGASGRVDTGAITKAPRKMRVSDKNWRDKVANQLEDLKNAVPALDGEIKRTKAEIFNGATEFIRTTVNDNAKLKWQIQQQKRMMQEAECVHKQARLRADSYAANNGMLILEHDEHTLTLGPRLVYADHHWKLMTGHMRPEGKRVPELCGTDHNPFMYSACDVINRTIFEATEQWFGIMICRRRDGTIMGCHSSIEPLTLGEEMSQSYVSNTEHDSQNLNNARMAT